MKSTRISNAPDSLLIWTRRRMNDILMHDNFVPVKDSAMNPSECAQIKAKYDPDGLFFVHNGVGSEHWSADGFSKLRR